jgi:hypothetical protein
MPSGLRKGHGYLFTGDDCQINVISRKSVRLNKLLAGTSEDFQFLTWHASSHTPINGLIEDLERKPKDMKMTQLIEDGNGHWTAVKTFKYNGDNGKKTIGSLGWGKSGDDIRTRIWVYIERA